MEAKTVTHLGTVLTSTYDARLVGISLVIAVVGSYTALDLAGQVAVAQGRARYFWLTGSAIAMGISIWAMHFIAMLAYQLPIPVTYVFSTVLISMAVATVGSIFGLFVVTSATTGVAVVVERKHFRRAWHYWHALYCHDSDANAGGTVV